MRFRARFLYVHSLSFIIAFLHKRIQPEGDEIGAEVPELARNGRQVFYVRSSSFIIAFPGPARRPGKFFYPSFHRGFAVSGAPYIHKNSIFVGKDATSELDFEAENLRFREKMCYNETTMKYRKKVLFEPLREEQSAKSGERE